MTQTNDCLMINAIESHFGRRVKITYFSVNQGNGTPEEQESGTLIGRFNGDSSNAGRTIRYEFDAEAGQNNTGNPQRYYFFVDEITGIQRLKPPKTLYQFPTTQAFNLTEDQRYTLLHSLRVAAEKFEANAETCREEAGGARIADQFIRQAAQTREIADRIESAEYVKLGRETD